MAAYVMVGFDSAGELSEETRDPRRTAPAAIIRALLASGIGGGLLVPPPLGRHLGRADRFRYRGRDLLSHAASLQDTPGRRRSPPMALVGKKKPAIGVIAGLQK